jgi:CRISPR-associated protein Csc3
VQTPTLLQSLLTSTVAADTDPILVKYIETVVPAMERVFGLMPALGGSYEVHLHRLSKQNIADAATKAERWGKRGDQTLLVHVLNALLIAWRLSEFIIDEKLSDIEKKLLCLGLTLHDYNKYCNAEEKDSPKAYEVNNIVNLCLDMGEKLNFDAFWDEWQEYISDISFLAQNTQSKIGANLATSNWPKFKILDVHIRGEVRLIKVLRPLLSFGDIAVHANNPKDAVGSTTGDRLTEKLQDLKIERKLYYHSLQSTTGILSNGIHNAVLNLTRKLDWQPILFFAKGVVYLVPLDAEVPDRDRIKEALWEKIEKFLSYKMLGGDIGFKRDGKGVKVAPQTLELFSTQTLLQALPEVIAANVKNEKNPATPKRLESLDLSSAELEKLKDVADIRSDRLAEIIALMQREFFPDTSGFISWVLEWLSLEKDLSPEDTQAQKGGVNYGWYRVAASYILRHNTLDKEQLQEKLKQLVEDLVIWGEDKKLFQINQNPTKDTFFDYIDRYLELPEVPSNAISFALELEGYENSKTKKAKQPTCSLSSSEFPSEEQMDSVVLFKPQQYSNKNPLGGGRIKRGISKIWSLEMLMRQSLWAVPSGKMEGKNPVFLYLFPAYVYSPQMAAAVRNIAEGSQKINFWDIHKFWLESNLDVRALRKYSWLPDYPKDRGDFAKEYYGKASKQDLPFMGIIYTSTMGKTATEAWIEPTLLSLVLAASLGIKVVASTSQVPLYGSDAEFLESVKLDGVANFWTVLGLPTSMRIEELYRGKIISIEDCLERLLIACSIHRDSKAEPPDLRWQAFPQTVRQITTNVLNIFQLANEGLRKTDSKRNPSPAEVSRYWNYAQKWSLGDEQMTQSIELTKRLVEEYRRFYRVSTAKSSHTILLPISKALENILSTPQHLSTEDLIFQSAGQLQDAMDRQEVYNRPIIKDESVEYDERKDRELQAIHQFMQTCVNDLFHGLYKGDRALLQENRNRIKSGAEFAYRWLELAAEKSSQDSPPETDAS